MKKYLYFLFAGLVISLSAKASPGDTTWVQANVDTLTWYGTFDSTVTFPAPGLTYRRIYMIVTLGKYMCPAGSTYCGDWDYTVQNYLMTPGGDTLELGRLITPYANAGAPRTPWTWQQPYVFDVTDYAALLQNSATIRLLYSGYSGGFTANIKFAFIEGIPDRNVLGIQRLWHGSFTYGDTAHLDSFDINTHFTALTETAPAGTQTTDLKFIATGHGSDANGCCEFMPHSYQVMLNGGSVATQLVWRNNCGLNELYPQSGTWPYQRSNWCPGDRVYNYFHPLPGIVGGSSYNVAIQFDPYAGSGSLGIYTTEASIIYYGPINKTLDASIEGIIAPTLDPNHFRENPLAGTPTIHVKNTGSTPITSIAFQYFIDTTYPASFTWTGNLAPLADTDIVLPEPWELRVVSGTTGTHNFTAEILQVNGVTDNDQTNDTMTSSFMAAPQWPVTFKIEFRTNSETDPATGNCETYWQITDAYNNIVAQRYNAAVNTTFTDTVTLGPAPYKFEIYDTVNCDGLQWWAFADYTPPPTSGYIFIRKLSGVTIPMNGYNYGGTYNNDFGCGFTQYFTTNFPAGVANITESNVTIEAYPNPALNIVNVDITGMQDVKGELQLMDVLGRVVSTRDCNTAHQQMNLDGLANGVYTIVFINSESGNKLTTRLLITK